MATVIREILIDNAIEHVWAAIRDVGALHTRLVPGFVTATVLERDGVQIADGGESVSGVVRRVKFGNGMDVVEPIISRDDATRRLAWGAIGGPLAHYNASVQVFADSSGSSRVIWTADLLPDAASDQIDGMIAAGLQVMKATLDRPQGPAATTGIN
ncbi:carbon monoxide dehydrogenase subunit G [Sphingomonas sp. UYAg733]